MPGDRSAIGPLPSRRWVCRWHLGTLLERHAAGTLEKYVVCRMLPARGVASLVCWGCASAFGISLRGAHRADGAGAGGLL